MLRAVCEKVRACTLYEAGSPVGTKLEKGNKRDLGDAADGGGSGNGGTEKPRQAFGRRGRYKAFSAAAPDADHCSDDRSRTGISFDSTVVGGERMEKLKNIAGAGWLRIKYALQNEEGISVIELILVLVVIIGLVIIFKSQLTSLVESIFEKITSESAGI